MRRGEFLFGGLPNTSFYLLHLLTGCRAGENSTISRSSMQPRDTERVAKAQFARPAATRPKKKVSSKGEEGRGEGIVGQGCSASKV